MKQISTLKKFENVKDFYFINDEGLIYNNKRGKYLKHTLLKNGYYRVTLQEKTLKKEKQCYIHQLLGRAFIDNETDKHIDHINRIRTDNRLENLRYVSRSKNQENRNVQPNNKLGHKNIYFSKKEKRYIVDIKINGKRKIKREKTLEDAIKFRDTYIQACETP